MMDNETRAALSRTRDSALGMVDGQVRQRTSDLAGTVDELVGQLRQIGDQLRSAGGAPAAQLTERIAGYGEQIAGYLRDADLDTLLHDAETFGRQQPLAVAAAGATLGFALSRTIKLGSARRYSRFGDYPTYDARAQTPTSTPSYAGNSVTTTTSEREPLYFGGQREDVDV